MKFVITADEVRSVFGLSGVVHFPRHDAPHNRLNDRTARLLSAVGLPDTASVYAIAEGEEEINYSPMHRDVESLVYALTKFEALLQDLERGREGVGERVDALRGEITEFDPLPFADEESPWNPAFEEVIDGIW
ncbi:SUKH-4 family immunity protein [Streptomyces sp. WA6-1-16]|uniref:SUKH-4 family immunity protein n=1 Tax=Streptomyces sp. WA6-1-16 TaxID=2879427 RepID=UPI001CE2E8A8|nr:SUKH-4 family immunity protein [Streptomyces sp. WA6-1-16]UCA50884.1 SUKH-4 family immunity protein [Streptomyces sp. WA6-1-16]